MAVQEQTPYIEYTANGVTKNFALEFDCENKDHLIVTMDGDEPPVSDWSLNDGAVVFIVAPASGSVVAIQRNTPFERTTDYQSYNNSFRPGPVNKDFDWIWWKLQELGYADFLLNQKLAQEILDRIAADEQMLDYILNQDNALKADYISRDAALKQYIDQMIALVTGDSSFSGITTDFVTDTIRAKTQKQINDDLLGDDGSNFINVKLTAIASAIKKSLYDVVYDQIVDVSWFEAKGDWNPTAQTGADDTIAVQNAISYYATLGTRRTGARRAIKFPYGSYRIAELTVPASMIFGIDFIGDGQHSSHIWFDHTNTNPAMTSLIEFVQFRDLGLYGSLSDQNGGNSALWKSLGFKGKLATNYPDIDVKFDNCGIYFFQDFAQVYGRGCVFENCSIGFVNAAMHIVADPDTVFTTGSYFTSLETGMRHYTFRNCRFDVVSRIYKISGTGAQKDYINGILCVGNDFAQCDILIEGPDATIRRPLIAANMGLYSFTTGIVQVKSSAFGQMTDCNWSKEFNDAVLPDATGDCINSLWKTTGGINGLIIANVTAKNISGNIVSAGGASSDVKIANNNFPQAWTYANGATNHFVFYSPVNCDGLQILGNSFQTGNQNGSYFMYDASVQNSKKTKVQANTAPWTWQDHRLRYTPTLLVNGEASATPAANAHGRYHLDDNYVYAEVLLVINPAETTGELAISLPPVSAIAENSNIASTYAGNGVVARYAGFTATANTAMSSIVVNPSNQQAELWKVANMTQSRITAADRTGSITLLLSFKYKY